MKNYSNKKVVFVMIALMLVVVGGYFVAGTYAKYTSQVSGTASASVAGWKWTIGEEDLKDIIDNKESKYTLNLFDTIYEEDIATAETDVSANNIAPGTGGKFTISIKNLSEVNATYAYNLTVSNALGAKLQWSTDNSTWTEDVTELSKNTTKIASGASADDVTIYWKWAFDESAAQDALDTKAGLSAGSGAEANDITVTASLVLTQDN